MPVHASMLGIIGTWVSCFSPQLPLLLSGDSVYLRTYRDILLDHAEKQYNGAAL